VHYDITKHRIHLSHQFSHRCHFSSEDSLCLSSPWGNLWFFLVFHFWEAFQDYLFAKGISMWLSDVFSRLVEGRSYRSVCRLLSLLSALPQGSAPPMGLHNNLNLDHLPTAVSAWLFTIKLFFVIIWNFLNVVEWRDGSETMKISCLSLTSHSAISSGLEDLAWGNTLRYSRYLEFLEEYPRYLEFLEEF
jgi:hypothetical protein